MFFRIRPYRTYHAIMKFFIFAMSCRADRQFSIIINDRILILKVTLRRNACIILNTLKIRNRNILHACSIK